MPVMLLRTFNRSRKFLQEIEEVQLSAQQVRAATVSLDPAFNHTNPTLEAIFDAAVPPVAEILEKFDESHPVVANFNAYFQKSKAIERSRNAGIWMCSFGLVPTPELEAVLEPALGKLLEHNSLADLLDPERNIRVLGVGSALLQSVISWMPVLSIAPTTVTPVSKPCLLWYPVQASPQN
ncbi:hypothetical protein B0H15DRAFT_824681 [Mycena belliarum]|uniref:Uncharacterized protein n=1 Tax=Mycena belliarum TaxID=1033014 RepID=A0AAD6UAA0_9AGAR|nr:hypothetical protein B0H15DRAFT_824681 [Mycena belliae]